MSKPSTHDRQEVLAMLAKVDTVAVATSAGATLRTRMMHYAFEDDFTIYLASMKGDPKLVQMAQNPATSLLVLDREGEFPQFREVEITGKAMLIGDAAERQRALEATALRSPIVGYLKASGNAQVLDYIKVVPETVKYRIVGEVVQGAPPTVFDFPQNRQAASDWAALRRKLAAWRLAVRVPFLTAALLPVVLGSAIAWAQAGAFHWGWFLLALVAGLAIHAAINLANDFFDHSSGNDAANVEFVRPFSGGSRAIQLGLLSPVEVLLGSLVLFGLAGALGAILAWQRTPWILLLGVLGFASGFFYSGRPFAWVNRGLGEALVALNFGILMTLGAYMAQATAFSWTPVIASLPLAAAIAAVLLINEIPDATADRAVGKRTLVVRAGRGGAVALYGLLLLALYGGLVAAVAAGALPYSALLALASLPLAAWALAIAARHYERSFDLAPANALTITIHLSTGALLTLAYVWERLGSQGAGVVAALGLAAAAFIVYMSWHVVQQKRIFHGLKQAIR